MPAGAPGMTLRCEFCGVQTRIPQAPIPMVPFGGGQPPIYPVPQGYMPGAPVKMSPVYYIVPFAISLTILGIREFILDLKPVAEKIADAEIFHHEPAPKPRKRRAKLARKKTRTIS